MSVKFLYLTDSHITNKQPAYRKDHIFTAQLKKLSQVIQIAKAREVDFILHGGDFFDQANSSLRLVGEVIDVIKDNEIPFYVIPGNHDIVGYNLSTLDRTGLGILAKAGYVKLLISLPLFKKGVSIFPCPPGYVGNKDYSPHDVIVVHDLLVPFDLPFEHKKCQDIDSHMKGALFLCGDYHHPFEYKGNNIFLNPGCLLRTAVDEKHIAPSVYFIEGARSQWKFELIPLQHIPNPFNEQKIEAMASKELALDTFMNDLQQAEIASVNPAQLAKTLGEQQKLDLTVIKEVLRRLSDASRSDKETIRTSTSR